MVYCSNVLKYIPDEPGLPKESNLAQAEDPTRKLMEACVLPVLQAANTSHWILPQGLLKLCLKVLKKHSMLKQTRNSVLFNVVHIFKMPKYDYIQ